MVVVKVVRLIGAGCSVDVHDNNGTSCKDSADWNSTLFLELPGWEIFPKIIGKRVFHKTNCRKVHM